MNTGYHRKKQPARVRQQVLDVAARISGERGMTHLTLDAVARAAGITKGGLLHHFPNKQALLEGLCDALLEALDTQIAAVMEQDPDPVGRFSRAYLEIISTYQAGEDARRASVLYPAVFAEASLRDRWRDWLEEKFRQNARTDSALSAWIVRLAADGLWLSDSVGDPQSLRARRPAVMAELIAMTRRN